MLALMSKRQEKLSYHLQHFSVEPTNVALIVDKLFGLDPKYRVLVGFEREDAIFEMAWAIGHHVQVTDFGDPV